MYMYEGYHFWGMHLLWWIVWFVILIWIFAIPSYIPGQRAKKDTPLNLLKKRFTLGEINKDEYLEKKKLLEN